MSKLHIDISDFEHIKSDKDKTTLKSKKFGHTVTVAHNTLHPDTRKIFERLQETGVTPQKKAKGGPVDKMKTTNNINGTKPEPGYTKMAMGGHPDMEDIKHGDPNSAGLPCLNPHCKSHGKPHPNCRCYSGGEFAEGGEVETVCSMKIPHLKNCQHFAEGGEPEPSPGPDTLAPNKDKAEAAQRGLNQSAGDQLEEGAKRLADPSSWWAEGGEIEHNSPGMMSSRAPFKDGGEAGWKQGDPVPEGWSQNDDGSISKNESTPGVGDHLQNTIHSILDWAKDKGEAHAKDLAPQTEAVTGEKPYQAPPVAPQQAEAPQPGQVPSALAAPTGQDAVIPADTAPNVAGAPPPSLAADPNAAPPEQPTTPEAAPAAPQSVDPLAQALPQQSAPGPSQHPAMASAQASMNDYKSAEQATINDRAKGHITPKTFQSIWHDKSVPGKIGMILGMIIGGFDPAGKGNGFVEALHSVIQNDLDAQKTSASNAQNLLRIHQQTEMNKAQQSNLNADTALKAQTKAQADAMWLGYDHLTRAVRQLPDGSQQKQNAEQMLAAMAPLIQQSNTTAFAKAAATEAMMKYMQPGASNIGDESQYQAQQQRMRMSGNKMLIDQAERNDARHIPGVPGQASRDLGPQEKREINDYDILDKQLQKVQDSVNKYGAMSAKGNFDPRVMAQIAVQAHEAGALYNKTLDGLGLTPGREAWIGKQIPDEPQKFLERLKGSKEKLQEVSDNNKMRKNSRLQGYGFPVQDSQGGQKAVNSSIDSAKAWLADPKNAKDKRFNAVKAMAEKQ